MSYIKQTLAADEVIHGQFNVHWWRYAAPVALFMVAAAMSFTGWRMEFTLIVSLCAFWLIFQIYGIEQGVTSRRLYLKTGIFSRHTKEMLLGAVETVELRQTLSDRLMGTGSVIATGKGGASITFSNIENPVWVKQMIEAASARAGDGS